MRSKSLSGVVWGVVVTVLSTLLLPSLYGQQTTNIFMYDQYWSFERGGTNLPVTWKTNNYDDSAWPSSPAVFGWPIDEVLPEAARVKGAFLWSAVPTNSPTGSYVQTFYLRTTFEFTNATTNVVLVGNAVIDDGAVFYLNGVELGRVGMPAGAVTYSTSASRGGDVNDLARGVDVLSWGPTNLIRGTNVLAVEVHQQGAGSSDWVFGMDLSWYRGTRVAITRQPTNVVVDCAGKPGSLSVLATGTDLSYLWYSNSVYMSNQVGSTMTLPAATTTADNASFYVIVSNQLSTVRSSNAVLRVFPDQCGPRVLLAESRDFASVTASNEIDLTFSEVIPNSSRITNNFSIVQLDNPTNVIRVTNVLGGGATTILRASAPLRRTNSYMLTINGVRDNFGNIIAPNTTIGVSFKTNINVIPAQSTWKYTDIWTIPPPFDNTWTNLTFDDADWGDGTATFVRDNVTTARCLGSGPGTGMGFGATTIYFRKRFAFLGNLGARVELILTNQVDDGAVWYLNGNEILRTRMPAGPIGHETRPSPDTSGEYPCTTATMDVSSAMINRGNNILAVEMHNTSMDLIGDDDALFETALSLGIQSGTNLVRAPSRPLSITRTGPNLTIGWPTNGLGTNNGYILQFANHINTNLWREVQTNMANPFITPMTNAARFYRLCWE